MAEKILDDSDQGFGADNTSSLYLSKDKDGSVVLEVEGAVIGSWAEGARNIEHIYLSRDNLRKLIGALYTYGID